MSEQALHRFLETLLREAAVRDEAAAALSALAVKHGFECTPAECAGIFKVPGEVPDGELSDDALTAVAGGAGATSLAHSITLSMSQQSDGLRQVFKTR